MPAFFWIILFAFAVWPWLPWKRTAPRVIVLYGFSILGETLNQRVFPAFQLDWASRTGEHVEFASSFAGSGTITNQLIMGVPAQLALLSLELDAERLAEAGVIPSGVWKQLPHGGVVNRTPFIILVRPGNPKHIRSFSDLARPGIKLVHPDPLTSGAANWAILAEYGSAVRQNPDRPRQAGHDLLLNIWRNVVAQAQSARSARSQFENGFGDALITYEQEALWDRAHGRLNSEIVNPPSTILSEHILVLIGRNIDPGQRELVNAFIGFLWSNRAQRLFIDSGFRSVDERLNALNPGFGKIQDLFQVSEMGGWRQAEREIIDRVWKKQVLKELGQQP
jgi:sulfate transport system substrate-binding protein